MLRFLAFLFLFLSLSAGAQSSWHAALLPPATETKTQRPTQKTENFLRSGTRHLRAGKHRQAVLNSWDAFRFCDPIMALNLRGVSEACWGKWRAADRSFSLGVEKAQEEGRRSDTLLFNRALLNLQEGDPEIALRSLREMEFGEAFPDYFFNLALSESLCGRYAQALDHWNQALERDSSLTQTWYNRGWTFAKLNKSKEALADFRRALQEHGPKGAVHLAVASALAEKGQFEEALRHAKSAYVSHRQDFIFILAYGYLLLENGQYRVAQSVFGQAAILFPTAAEVHCGLATASYHLRDFNRATRHYNKALWLDPGMPQALIGRGHLHSYHGRFQEALLDFRLALDSQPGNSFAWEGIGIANFRLGWYQKAAAAFNIALSNPKYRLSFDACISQGFTAYRLGRLQEAKEAFEKAIVLEPHHPSGFNGLACTYFEMEEFLLSEKNFDLAVKYGPTDDVILTNRGNARYRIMDYKGALKDFRQAVEINPDNEHAWNGLGICYHESEDYETAVQMIEKAIRLDTTNKDLNMNLGVSRGLLAKFYRETGRPVLADTAYQRMLADHQRMLDLWADSSIYFINMGYLHAQLNKWDRSMELFQSVGNPLALQYAENNMGILYALKDQYGRAGDLFSSAIARDTSLEYAAPRVNRILINQAQGRLQTDSPNIIDQISTVHFQKILERDKFYYTYFYYTLMRYAPPPPEVGFHSPYDIEIPGLSRPRGKYLLYPPSVECRRVKQMKPEVVRVKKETRKGKGRGCPEL